MRIFVSECFRLNEEFSEDKAFLNELWFSKIIARVFRKELDKLNFTFVKFCYVLLYNKFIYGCMSERLVEILNIQISQGGVVTRLK